MRIRRGRDQVKSIAIKKCQNLHDISAGLLNKKLKTKQMEK